MARNFAARMYTGWHTLWEGVSKNLVDMMGGPVSASVIAFAVVVTYAMIAAYIGLGLVLGLRHAILLAMLTGFLEMIPVVGLASSAIIAGIFAIQSADSIWSIVAYAIYASALRLSIDRLVGPVVLGRAAAVPPVIGACGGGG